MRRSLDVRRSARHAPSSTALTALFGVATVALGVVACNALSGASDLAICNGSDCLALGATGEAGMVNVNGAGDSGADALPASCTGNETACSGLVSAGCVSGNLVKTTCPKTCEASTGKCADYPSCRNAAGTNCGVLGTGVSCCESSPVPGGTFNRRNSMTSPATVSPFSLDDYEVTVGRMRAFVDAGGVTRLAPPAAGAGAHPKIPGSGWNPVWNAFLPDDIVALRASFVRTTPTWTDKPGANEHLPMNTVSWFIALSFCAWDGGRLPTYAEMSFAAAGGSEQRSYPWSVPASDQSIASFRAAYDCNFQAPARSCPASYCSDAAILSSPCNPAVCIAPAACMYPACTGCALADIAPVGSRNTGVGKWGQLDLSGNVAEFVYDTDGTLPMPCVDCVHAPPAALASPPSKPPRLNAFFIVTGGGWDVAPTSLFTSSYTTLRDDLVESNVGFRCAR
jgi:sulfatase modifying factor 1